MFIFRVQTQKISIVLNKNIFSPEKWQFLLVEELFLDQRKDDDIHFSLDKYVLLRKHDHSVHSPVGGHVECL